MKLRKVFWGRKHLYLKAWSSLGKQYKKEHSGREECQRWEIMVQWEIRKYILMVKMKGVVSGEAGNGRAAS